MISKGPEEGNGGPGDGVSRWVCFDGEGDLSVVLPMSFRTPPSGIRAPEGKKKILLVRLSSGGDVLQTLPALAILRRRLPDAHLTFLVEDRFAPFVQGRPEIDTLRIWPRRQWSPFLPSRRLPGSLAGALAFFAETTKARFDTVLDFQGNLKSGLHTGFSLAPLRVGFDRRSAREGNVLFTNRRVPASETGSRIVKYVALLAGIGITGERPAPVPLPSGAAEAHERAAADQGRPREGFLAVHPGTSPRGAAKQWPLERWRTLLSRLGREGPVLLSWGPGEEPAAEALRGIRGVFTPPRPLGVPALAGALVRARAFVGPDSAPLHLAHVLGCPAVGLFGPTDPARYAPWMTGEAVASPLPCAPCHRWRCADPVCMEAIEVDEVAEAIARVTR